jgi:hypothetical protein
MKNRILPVTILLLGLFTAANSFSQSRKFFAVTGEQYGSVNWIAFRQMDMDGVAPVKTLYIPAESGELTYDAVTRQQIANIATDAVAKTTSPQTCGCLNNRMVAAIAYDAINNRLYYTPMLSNQLRYLDLSTERPKSYVVTTQLLKAFANQPGEASVVTRMCFAANGFGYALTNDGEHLLRFSTAKQTSITDLGKLTDASTNGDHSVKTQFKSWGGDLVADANGGLYLFAMQRSVFKINLSTRVATYLGDIQNIPADYTVNAAMVEESGNVIVGSSTNTSTYYRVNLTTLQASEVNKNSTQVYNVSDFANANLAFAKSSSNQSSVNAKTISKAGVSIYPNPVANRNLDVQFSNFATDKYIIQISEMEGKSILQKELNISGSQTENIVLPLSITAGTYLLKVVNNKGEVVYTNKVIVN